MSFAGTWQITIATPMGEQKALLEIVTEGTEIRGTASQHGDSAPFLDPVLKGDTLSWSQDIKKPMPMTVKFELTRAGDSLRGTAKAGFFLSAAVTGERIQPA